MGLGEGEGEGLFDGDGLGEGEGDGEGEGLGEGFGVGLGLDGLALGDEPVGEDVDGEPVAGGGDGSAAISRPKVGGRITLGAGDKLGLASEGVSACMSGNGDDEGTRMALDGAKEGGESAKSSVPLVAWALSQTKRPPTKAKTTQNAIFSHVGSSRISPPSMPNPSGFIQGLGTVAPLLSLFRGTTGFWN